MWEYVRGVIIKYIAAKNVSVRRLNICVCVHVWSNVEVHEKVSILKDHKYTNFDMAMNVFLRDICSPISRLQVWSCVQQISERISNH